MKTNRIIKLLLLILVFFVIPKQIFSQNDVNKTLQGFNTLKVVVESLKPEMERAGLTEQQIQTDVEIKLRKAGFNVKDKDGFFSPFIYLYINLQSFHSDSGSVAYHLETSLRQEVLLDRNKTVDILASTWNTAETGTIGRNNIRQLRDSISDQVDNFINDYLKVNASTSKTDNNLPDLSKYAIKTPPPPLPKTKQDDSPFTATYVGGNSPPTVDVFNDTDRTMYFDFGQGNMTAYTIPSQTSQKITLAEGIYNYKASAPRVRSKEGEAMLKKGYVYSWRFFIVTAPR
jgi:hypothetical protein